MLWLPTSKESGQVHCGLKFGAQAKLVSIIPCRFCAPNCFTALCRLEEFDVPGTSFLKWLAAETILGFWYLTIFF
jgi:hypothetical protein